MHIYLQIIYRYLHIMHDLFTATHFFGIATELTKKADLASGKDKVFNDRPDPNTFFG